MGTAANGVEAPAVRSVAEALGTAVALLQTAGIETARLDAEVLLAVACGADRTWLYAHPGQPLTAPQWERFTGLLARRRNRESLACVLGGKEFWSRWFSVTPDVLVPRPETELLVELAVSELSGGKAGLAPTLCDVGTGSGCIAVTLALELPAATVWALDTSPAALWVAMRNAERYDVAERVRCVQSDLFAAVPRQRFDAIVANLPYIPSALISTLSAEVQREPRAALDGGVDGLAIIGRMLGEASAYLSASGVLLAEIGFDQGPAAAALAAARGWRRVSIHSDAAGQARVLAVRR